MPAGTGDLQIIHVFPLLKVKQRQLTEHQDLWLDDITLDVMDRQPGKAANRALKAYRLLSFTLYRTLVFRTLTLDFPKP